jgi:hypothetical protein
MSEPQSQIVSQNQSENIQEKLIETMVKRAIQEEDTLIAKKLQQRLQQLIETNEDEETNERLTKDEMLEELRNMVWNIARMFAVLRSGYQPKFHSFYDTYEYSDNEMTLSISGITNYEGHIEVDTPSGAEVGCMTVEFTDASRKSVYELATQIYNKWNNLLEMVFKLAEEVAKEVAKDP